MKYSYTKAVALGGILASLAVIIMCLGGLIPVATYTCPVLCMILLNVVCLLCGKRNAWAWFGAVVVLSVLMGPDKEAAAIFAFLGYYPLLKPFFDERLLPWLWKGIFFNISLLLAYGFLIYLMGIQQIVEEFAGYGVGFTAVLLLLGNVCLFLVDMVLSRILIKFRRR